MKPLEGRVAVATGASRGMGRSIALRLAEDGADSAIIYRKGEEQARDAAGRIEALGRRALALPLDLREPEQVGPVSERVGEAFGRVDILVANAAATAFRPMLEQKEPNIRRTFAISVDSFVAATPVRRGGTGEDVAALVAYLASDGAGFLTGQTILIDGGLTIVSPLHRPAEDRRGMEGEGG